MKPLAIHRHQVLGCNLEQLSKKHHVSRSLLSMIERGYSHKDEAKRRQFARIYELNLETFDRLVEEGRCDGV